MNKDNVHQWNDRTNEFRTKKNIFFEVCENRDFWILSIILSLALIFAIPAPVVFAGSADEITDDREARRHAMLQAWLFEDHTRITHPKDREKYNLPPLGTAEAKRYSPPNRFSPWHLWTLRERDPIFGSMRTRRIWNISEHEALGKV